MASINPTGGFVPQPPTGGSRNLPGPKEGSDFNIEDGLTLSTTGSPEKLKFEFPNLPVKGPEDPQAWYDPATQTINFKAEPEGTPNSSSCLLYELGEIGGGLLNATTAINAPKDGAGVSEFTFTNGLNSTQIIGLSGRTLADVNPLRQ